ncbi:MAG: response regulator, partial [Lachnospiraceae bacterium]|nr:response regulator [Lachnospiraceae bacterium]
MKVLIVDDEAAVAEDLATVLKKVLSYAVIKSAFSASTALQMVRKEAFDVALLDIRMPDKDGLALAKEIKEIRPLINIIMVTAYPEYALEAHKLFVSGYLL